MVAVVVLALAAAPAAAQDARDALSPCRRSDVLGLWTVLRLGVAPSARVDRSDAMFDPHQRYVFHANATMLHATSTKAYTPADERALLAAPATTTWAVDLDGRLLLQKEGAIRLEVAACRVLLKEVKDPRSSEPAREGDMLLTEYDENDRPVARRLLRKLRPAQPAE